MPALSELLATWLTARRQVTQSTNRKLFFCPEVAVEIGLSGADTFNSLNSLQPVYPRRLLIHPSWTAVTKLPRL